MLIRPVLLHVPTVLSPHLAPPGKHVLNAYTQELNHMDCWEDLISEAANTRS